MNRKLNFGCGSIIAPDWHNVDKEDFGQSFIGSTELFQDNYFDIIVAHCSLQMVEWHDLPKVLKELHRILKPGGVIRFSLPNILAGFRAYEEGNADWFPNSGIDIDEKLSGWLTWFSSTKTLLTPMTTVRKLMDAGFEEPWGLGFKQTRLSESQEILELDTRENECYFIEAEK